MAMTLSPYVRLQWFGTTSPLAGGKLYTYAAGTTTPIDTYGTIDGSVVNTNPIILNAAGRPTSNGTTETGLYLRPGQSYKFVLTDAAGVPVWTQDDIPAVPPSSVNLDLPGTAGEAVLAGQVCYLSDGAGGRTAGQWYLADADQDYASITPVIGVAVASASAGTSTTFRVDGRAEGLTGLAAGTTYYVSSTAGGLTSTATARAVGVADSATTLVIRANPPANIFPLPADGRLTLASGTPVTTSDVTGATTIYYTPYRGTRLALYDGVGWRVYAFSELSLAVPATTNTVYDVFVFANAGVPTLELTAWTNDTTRATALTRQDGVLVKSGATTRRYLGTFRTTGVSGQTEDSAAKRYLWNAYHRVPTPLQRFDTTASWTYATASWRQARAQSTNQVEWVAGLNEDCVEVRVQVMGSIATGGNGFAVGVALDATQPGANTTGSDVSPGTSGERVTLTARYLGAPGIGRHFVAWCEYGNPATVTFYGTGPSTSAIASGLLGWMSR